MKKFMTERSILILFGLVMLVTLTYDSYFYLTVKFPAVAEPFASNEKLYSYVYDALKQIWMRMLYWPFLFFVILIYTIVRHSRQNSSEDMHQSRNK